MTEIDLIVLLVAIAAIVMPGCISARIIDKRNKKQRKIKNMEGKEHE